jgi:hypothetical protein
VSIKFEEADYRKLIKDKGDKTMSGYIKALIVRAGGDGLKETNSLINLIKEIAESVKVSELRLRQLEDLPERINANQAGPEPARLDIEGVQRSIDKTLTDLKNNQLTPTFDYVSGIKAQVTEIQKKLDLILKKSGLRT